MQIPTGHDSCSHALPGVFPPSDASTGINQRWSTSSPEDHSTASGFSVRRLLPGWRIRAVASTPVANGRARRTGHWQTQKLSDTRPKATKLIAGNEDFMGSVSCFYLSNLRYAGRGHTAHVQAEERWYFCRLGHQPGAASSDSDAVSERSGPNKFPAYRPGHRVS